MAILIPVIDFPGDHAHTAARVGEQLSNAGHEVAFLLSTPYMERFKEQAFGDVGRVFYLSELLKDGKTSRATSPPPDQWWLHSSYVRQRYFRGRPRLTRADYAPLRGAIERVFDSVRSVDLVWSESPSSATLIILHEVATSRKTEYWGISAARVGGYFQLARDLYASDLVCSGGDGVPRSRPPKIPDYFRHTVAGRPDGIARRSTSARVLAGLSAAALTRGEHSPEVGWPPWWQIVAKGRRLEARIRWSLQKRSNKLFARGDELTSEGPTFLFPLQFRPEASTSVWAKYFEYDIQTIHNLAFSLPGNATLVAKEHPASRGMRPNSFYRALSRLPGVRVAHPDFDSGSKLSAFADVCALTSTMGFEALLAGVPVLLFGRTFYENYRGVARFSSWKGVPGLLSDLSDGRYAVTGAETWDRYRKYCFPGIFDVRHPETGSAENVEKLCRPILEFLGGGSGGTPLSPASE